ncbi:MAG: 6-carboxytetrahydropterin synthase QueD [Actinobacteria bacterium]|nr:6-carboxytetrahydropterin synthase QueD [Actinomycetota bacterium]
MYELTVKDHFDAAHALIGYPGQCKNLHGHTWEVEVSVEGTMLDSVGILYDFKTLKDDLAHILAIFDHAYLNDLDMFKDMNSTAENMARLVYDELSGKLPENVKLTEVCIWESPIARLRYRR